MPNGLPADIEVERIMNVIRGFGWVEIKRELKDTVLHLEISKTVLTDAQRPVDEEPT